MMSLLSARDYKFICYTNDTFETIYIFFVSGREEEIKLSDGILLLALHGL